MAGVLVDTDVVSYLFRRDRRARAYQPHLIGRVWTISFMTLAELEWGMLHRGWGLDRRGKMERYLQRFAVCYASADLCRLWAYATESAQRNGRPIGVADAWHAAAALALNVPLVTNNAADYAGVEGLTVVSEAMA